MRDLAIRAVVAALVLLGVAAFCVDWNTLLSPPGAERTADAALQGDPTQIKAHVAGYLTAVPVADYSVVHRGDLLYAIDDRDYRARVDRAQAAVAQAAALISVAEAQLAQQAAQIAAARAEIQGGTAELTRARQEQARQSELLHTESYLARDYQAALAGTQQSAAALDGDRRALTASQAQVGVLEAQLAGQRASFAGARAALALAQVELGYTRVVAPFGAVATSRLVRLGEYVAPGAALITLVPLQGAWAVANFREEQLTHMQPGQSAQVRVDALPGLVLSGHVDSIEPVSQAEGSTLPPDRAVGSFTKIVQRVPVKVALESRPDLAGRLRPGLSAEVQVQTGGSPP
jgi:membrane fusion protein (multidrug efflux system)